MLAVLMQNQGEQDLPHFQQLPLRSPPEADRENIQLRSTPALLCGPDTAVKVVCCVFVVAFLFVSMHITYGADSQKANKFPHITTPC